MKQSLKFAVEKLSPNDPNRGLALIPNRISFYVSEYSLAEHMVATCMRHIVLINRTRILLSTSSASEPILAYCAASKMMDPDRKLTCLQALLPPLSQGSINVGELSCCRILQL